MKNKWTYESCYNDAKKYKTKKDYRIKSPSSYQKAVTMGWLNEFVWLEKTPHKFKWTVEAYLEVAKKYKTQQEFRKNERGANIAGYRYGWYKLIDWFVPCVNESDEDVVYCVYGYIDEENKVAYIGLTKDIKMRHGRHISANDTVNQYFVEKYGHLCEPKILIDNLSAQESQIKEGFYVDYYNEKGYHLLNKAKTGDGSSSIGGNKEIYTKQVAEEISKKYDTLYDFYTHEESCYNRALKMGWLKDYVWLKRKSQKHTYDECFNVAKKYEYLKDFAKNEPKIFYTSTRNGWIKDFEWLKHERNKMTEEEVNEIVSRYKTLKELRKNEPNVYAYLVRHKKIHDAPIEREGYGRNGYWTYEACVEESKKYEYYSDFRYLSSKAYNAAQKRGWINDFVWLRRKINRKKKEK